MSTAVEVRKKSTKNIRRKKTWRRRHRPQLFRSYKRLLTSDLTNCWKKWGLTFLRQILLLIQPCHPQRSPLWTRNSMTSTVVSSTHASWNYFKPSLTWNGIPNAPSLESVESLCIEPCRTLTWVYLIEEYTTPTENWTEPSCVNAIVRLPWK